MKWQWRGWTVGIVGALALVLAGCGAATTPSSSSGVAPGLNNNEITLLGGIQVEPNFWFPIMSNTTCSTANGLSGLMYLPLLHISRTDGINFSRSIASGITVSNNDTTYTITLNPKWHWSNGQPVTAANVVFGWDIIQASSQPNAPWTYCGDGIGGVPQDFKSVTAPNPTTVVVTTTKAVNPVWFEHNGLGQLIPIPSVWNKHKNMTRELQFIQQEGNSPSNSLFSVIDGPYAFGSFVDNEYWTMVANPKYDGHQATIKKLLFEYETSSSNAFAAMRKGTFATAGLPDSYYPDRNQLTKNYLVETAPYGFCFNYMVPNLSSQAPGGMGSIFNQLYVRQALQLGIDQAAIVKDFDHGLAQPTYGPVPSVPPNKYYDPNIPKYVFNPAKGKKLLEDHGWRMVNGVMTKGHQKLAFTWLVVSGSNTVTNTAVLIKADWAQEGIDATIKEEPFNQVIATPPSKFQLEWWGGGWCYEPDYYPTGGGLFATGAASNAGDYSNGKMNQLIQATYSPQTPASAQKALDAYQVYAAQQLPVLYLPTATSLELVKPGLHGVNSDFNPITVGTSFNRWTIGKTP